eukprot:11102522-Ditylum_brightwellii.AAC.1
MSQQSGGRMDKFSNVCKFQHLKFLLCPSIFPVEMSEKVEECPCSCHTVSDVAENWLVANCE